MPVGCMHTDVLRRTAVQGIPVERYRAVHTTSYVTLDTGVQGCVAELRIKKTRQFGPTEQHLPASGTSTCPKAITHYCQEWGQVSDHRRHGLLFALVSGAPLTRRTLNGVLRRALGPDYSSHSMRTGLATTAAAAGVPDSAIPLLGRWTARHTGDTYGDSEASCWRH